MMGFTMQKKKNRKAAGVVPAAANPTVKSSGKKKKFSVPEEKRPIICPPDKAGMSLKVRVFGYICRAAVTFTAVFGIVFFLCDALKLEAQSLVVPTGFIALVCLVSVAVFSLMRLSKYGLLGGSVFIAGVLTWVGISAGDIITLAVNIFVTAKNVALTRLYNIGYYAMSKYMTEITYTAKYTQEYYFKYAVAIIAVLLSLAFVMSTIKRVRVAIPAVISTALLGVIFTYNISRSNWGVVLIIASFMGLLVMAAYDRLFSVKPDSDKYDTKTVLFEDDGRPKMPDGVLTRSAARMLRRQKNQEFRELKKKHKKEKTEITVDEELSDYFGRSVKHKEKTPAEKKIKLTREEKKAAQKDHRELMRQVRRVEDYDRAVGQSRAAQGGFAAFGAFLLAMLMLILPALTVSGSFSTIKVIDKKMEYYREYVTALLMGDDPILDELGYQNDKNNFSPHTTTAAKQNYTGARLFTVETQYNTDVYLRGWIGTDYNDGAWLAASDEQLEAYRNLYNTYLDPTETMFRYFYSIMNPDTIAEKDFTTKYTNNAKYGFIAMQVNVARVETGDSLVYMPAYYRISDEVSAERKEGRGLYEYGTSVPLDTTYVNYFDGIYTGRKFMSELAYASVSYVTTMKTINWYEYVAEYIAQYNEGYKQAYDEIEKYAQKKAKGKNATFDATLAAMFPESPSNLLSVTVDEAEKTKTIRVQYSKGVGEYVYSTETGLFISKKATDLLVDSYIDPLTGETVEFTVTFVPPDLELSIRFREVMTQNEKRALAYAYYYEYMYENFVYDTYLGTAGSKVISDMLDTIIASSVTVVKNYDDEGNVTETTVQDDFSKAVRKNSDDVLTYEQRHELVMAIVGYLKDNFTYTLDPTAVPDASLDGVENFLTVTKEGYCVQFASALALMLREAGIPARYVEGYVACDFNRNYNKDAVGRYVSTVRDWNAHAWVEVWYDGIGWVQYEATPIYYNDMYVKESGESSSIGRPWDFGEEITEEQELLDSLYSTIDSGSLLLESMRDQAKLLFGSGEVLDSLDIIEQNIASARDNWQIQSNYYTGNKDSASYDSADFIASLHSFVESIDTKITSPLTYQLMRMESLRAVNRIIWTVIGITLAAAVLAFIGIFIGTLAKKAEKKRTDLTDRIIAGNFTEEEKTKLARSVIDWLTALLSAYGSAPKKGEFRDEYADRLSAEYSDIFGRAKDGDTSTIIMPSALTSDTDFRTVFDAIAAEEFGYGMAKDDLIALAQFYKRMRSGAKKHLKPIKRIVYHYIKRII